jgi:hypothetical protein
MNPLINMVVIRLQKPTRNQAVSLSLAVTIVTFLFNVGIGIFSYLTEMPQDGSYISVTSFVFPRWFKLFISILAYIQVLICSSVYLFLVGKETLDLILPNGSKSTIARIIAALTFCCIIPLFNFISETAVLVLNYINQVCFFILAFLLPPLFYILHSRFMNIFWSVASFLLFAIGIAVQVLLNY